MKDKLISIGVSLGHNSSVSVVVEGKLDYYLEEERLSRKKHDGFPLKSFLQALSKYPSLKVLSISGTSDPRERQTFPFSSKPYIEDILDKYIEDTSQIQIIWLNNQHHLQHGLSAFISSGFPKSTSLVVDGAGSSTTQLFKNTTISENCYETETIFNFLGFNLYREIYKNFAYNKYNPGVPLNLGKFHFNSTSQIVKSYEAITEHLGWHAIEAGKVMGLSAYGKSNPSIPPLRINGIFNKNIFIAQYPGHSSILNDVYPQLKLPRDPREWHYDESKITDLEKDLAWEIQKETQEAICDLIDKNISEITSNNLCLSGGYGLNCVNNYYLQKKYPQLNIYIDPLSHDGGTSKGAAYFGYNKLLERKYFSKVNEIEQQSIYAKIATPLKSLYLGPKYTTTQYLETIKSYNPMFKQHKITPEQVAKLISERNIVTIFQGRSEAGPRALGNRSILYDPTDPKGKDFVNKVKNREWFRPFAGTVLLEKAHEYFDMAGLDESPFMMYAMDVWPNKQEIIPAITHVDGTCRIQTVTEEQNPHYYKLIQEFEKITGVPILFNTSFNLAGDPLVETIEDALETMLKSDMKYMYVPELEMLLEKK